jgi:hypothetical protein
MKFEMVGKPVHVPNVGVEWLASLFRIQNVLGQETGCVDSCLCFPHFHQASAVFIPGNDIFLLHHSFFNHTTRQLCMI